mmetsp:Transcript_35803/g.73205  ORF Transcript_35803/g.73205 Transcript_35803/m.73205 type:complete len:301 (-) Transcript_35803:22-924(-)
MAAIVDDREDVWANASDNDHGEDSASGRRHGEPPENLLLVRPYHWKPFLGFADVNNAAGRDISATNNANGKELAGGSQCNAKEEGEDEEAESQGERHLLWIGDILKRIHEQYYSPKLSEEERDELTVPGILREMRRDVLGAKSGSMGRAQIVFSGLVPLHRQQAQVENISNLSPRPVVVRYAEDLGAKVLPEVTYSATHVVAARDGTEKILKARRMVPSCAVVKASWLMECYWSVTRRNESSHYIGPPPLYGVLGDGRQMENSFSGEKDEDSRILLSGSDSSEDDEDILADFENEMMTNS